MIPADVWQHLSHELRSLLDGSMRSVGLLLRQLGDDADPPPTETLQRQLLPLKTALTQMHELIEQASGSPGRHHSGVPRTIGSVVEEISILFEPLIREYGITFDITMSEGIALHPGEPLLPILRNGVGNAVEALAHDSHPPRHVNVIVTQKDDCLRCIVDDNGPGLPDDFVIGTSTRGMHHGRGLPLVRDWVDSLGGAFSIRNRENARGVRFVCTIPLSVLKTHHLTGAEHD